MNDIFLVVVVYSYLFHFRKCIHILFGMTSRYLDSCHISIAMFSNICYHLFDCVSIEASAYNDRSNPLLWLTSHNNLLDACAYWSVDPYKVQRHLINTEKKSYLGKNSNYPWSKLLIPFRLKYTVVDKLIHHVMGWYFLSLQKVFK